MEWDDNKLLLKVDDLLEVDRHLKIHEKAEPVKLLTDIGLRDVSLKSYVFGASAYHKGRKRSTFVHEL